MMAITTSSSIRVKVRRTCGMHGVPFLPVRARKVLDPKRGWSLRVQMKPVPPGCLGFEAPNATTGRSSGFRLLASSGQPSRDESQWHESPKL